jgi:predicted transcriptional regulator
MANTATEAERPETQRRKNVSVPLTPEEYERLSALARESERSRGAVCRLAVRRLFAEESAGVLA